MERGQLQNNMKSRHWVSTMLGIRERLTIRKDQNADTVVISEFKCNEAFDSGT